MPNVIELENDLYYEIDENALFDQGIIKLNTDLHPDHTEEALVDILFIKHLLDDNDKIVDLYLKVLDDIDKNYNQITDYLFDTNHITSKQQNLEPHELLDVESILIGLKYLGGYSSFFKLLGYKVVELIDTYAIVAEDINDELIEDYTYGYHYYVVTLYQNGKKVESVHNVHIRNDVDLVNFVNNQFNLLTEFYLVDNPLTSRNFESIPKVNKIVENYRFDPIDKTISNNHLSHIENITFNADNEPEITIPGDCITTLRINNRESFNGSHTSTIAKDLFIHIDNIDDDSQSLINTLENNGTILSAHSVIVKYHNGSTFQFTLDTNYKLNTITADRSIFTIEMSNS